jgi:hypothetical protein
VPVEDGKWNFALGHIVKRFRPSLECLGTLALLRPSQLEGIVLFEDSLDGPLVGVRLDGAPIDVVDIRVDLVSPVSVRGRLRSH